MTKKQQAQFLSRLEAINRRGLNRAHAIAMDTMRQIENLKREYLRQQFLSTKPTREAR